MSEVDSIEVAITADTSNLEAGIDRATQKAKDFDSTIKNVGGSDFGDKIEAEADQSVGAFKKAEDAADSLVSKLKNLDIGSGLAGVSKVTGGVADGMQKIGIAATAVGVPVGLLAKNSLSLFADLESQTQRNTALLGGAKAEYEEILALSKELGASTPFDALEIGAGIESLAAAGYSLDEIQSAMPTVAEMAIATGEDLSNMSEILIATLSSYGEGADKAAMYGDKLATVANISSAGIGDFGESMKYVGAVADAFGVDIDELGASIATLADNNLKGSLAGTGLREIITTLANPTAKVRDIFESFGLTMDELNPKTNDFVDILAKMKDAGVSSEAMMAAFGDRAGPAAVILLEQIDKLKENYKTLLTESDGMLKEFSGKMRDTLGFVMDEMGGTIGNIMIEIGAGLKPIVQEMGKWLNENQQTLIDFAKNAVEGLTPFVEKFLGLAEKLMEWFNSLPKDMQSKIAGLTGLGAAISAIGGPLLLLGSIPVRAVSDITGALGALFSMGKVAGMTNLSSGVGTLVKSLTDLSRVQPTSVVQYITPIGPAAASAAGQVGLLGSAIAALGGPGVVALAGVTAGIVAWETDFMGVRSAALDAAEAISAGFGNAVESAIDITAGGGLAISEAFRGAFLDPNYESQLIPKLQAVFADATDTAELEGRAAASAWIDAWNSEIASGRIKAPDIPDSQTASRTNTGIPVDIPPGMAVVNGTYQPIPIGASVVNGTVYSTGAAQYGEDQKKLNELFAQFPTQQAQATQTGTQTGVEAAAPEIGGSVADALSQPVDLVTKLMEERNIQSREDAQKMFDSSEKLRERLSRDYGTNQPKTPAGTASDPLVVTTTTSTGTAAPTTINAQSVTVTSTGTGEKKLATDDLFTRDPALWLNKRLETLMQNYSGVNEYTADLQKSGSNWEDRIKREFMDAKSSGEGGSADWDTWWKEAQAGLPVSLASLEESFTGLSSVLQTLQKSISDGSASSSEAERYLDEYNQATGKNTEYTKKQTSQTRDMMNATDAFTDAQTLYNKYMDDGKLSASEATTVQAALAQGLDLMGSAGADTKEKIANLPPALKELASSIMDFFNQIKASVAQAQQDSMYADGWRTATNSSYESMTDPRTGKPVQRSYLDIDVILGLKEGSAKVDSLTEANTRLQDSIYSNVGTTNLLSSAYQAAGNAAIETVNRVAESAASAISRANAAISNLSYSNSGNSISATNYMPGMSYSGSRQMFQGYSPGWRNPSPCGWGTAFASGGPVTQDGPAYLHQGEYVIRRDEVNRLTNGGANVNLNINMSNSKFGNTELQKDLPDLIAKRTKRALRQAGVA